MRKKILLIIAVSVFLMGIGVLLYPSASKSVNSMRFESMTDELIEKMEQAQEYSVLDAVTDVEEIPENKSTKADGSFLEPDSEQLAKLYEQFKLYNQNLIENGQSSFGDPFIYEDDAVNLSDYGIYDGLVGVLSIPKIDLRLPIYLGATKENMAKGAAHLNRTSLPIGGESTNAVIAGHTGMIRKVMFDNITQLVVGDEVYIINYWSTLEYVVREIRIVEPNSHSDICIEKGSDLLTLITCYPYGSNSHRYLVICQRK